MYKLLFFLLLFLSILKADSQPLPDSTKAKYSAAKDDIEKGQCLMDYFEHQLLNDTTTKTNVLLLKSWFEKQKDAAGKNYTDLCLAEILENNGDFPGSLNLLFSVLPRLEKRKDSFGIFTNIRINSGHIYVCKRLPECGGIFKKGHVACSGR